MNTRTTLLVAIPLAAYIVQAWLYRDWLIDDAGISIAYAFNLAAGNGFVAQVGAQPVEGFSNPLWTLILSLTFIAGLFDVYWTPKALGCLLAGITFATMLWVANRMATDRRTGAWIFFGASMLTALNPAFVIWSQSGLENGLYAALVIGLVAITLASLKAPTARNAILAGVCAGLVALTRPDGVVFFACFPIVITGQVLAGAVAREAAIKMAVTYGLAFVAIAGTYLLFRVSYYGDLLPNTYYAKGGASLLLPFKLLIKDDALESLSALFVAFTPSTSLFTLALFVAFPLLTAASPAYRRSDLAILYLFAGTGAFIFLAMPPDWMGEFRFATPLFPVAGLWLLTTIATVSHASSAATRGHAPRIVAWASILICAAATPGFLDRTVGIPSTRAVSLADVTSTVSDFNIYQKRLGITEATFLTPDMGGTLMYSTSRAIDGLGLCDRTFARLANGDPKLLRDHVFDNLRPTFIFMHEWWSRETGFLDDSRFTSDYIKISNRHYVRSEALPPDSSLDLNSMADAARTEQYAKATLFPLSARQPLYALAIRSNARSVDPVKREETSIHEVTGRQ